MADVPDDLRRMLDEAAGREHSQDGIVMRTLAAILAEHKRQILAEAPAYVAVLRRMWRDSEQYAAYAFHPATGGYRDAVREVAHELGVDLDG